MNNTGQELKIRVKDNSKISSSSTSSEEAQS